MPSFRSSGSNSIRKMDHYGGSGRARFSMGNIIGDPFSLATIGIAIVSISRCARFTVHVLMMAHRLAGS